MTNKSVQNCRFVHHAKFHCIMTMLNRLFSIETERGGGDWKRAQSFFWKSPLEKILDPPPAPMHLSLWLFSIFRPPPLSQIQLWKGYLFFILCSSRFVLHTLLRNITHLAVITRKTNIKLGILKGGGKTGKEPSLLLCKNCQLKKLL